MVSLALVAWQWGRLEGQPLRGLELTRIALLVLVAGSLTMLDDPSRTVAEAVPVELRWRVGERVAAMLGWLVPAGGLVAWLVVGRVGLGPDGLGPAQPGLLVEAATVLVLGVAVVLLMQRRFAIDEPGQYAAPVLLMLPLALLLADAVTGGRWPLLVPPGPQWDAAHERWAALLVLGTLAVGVLTRDPAARWLRR